MARRAATIASVRRERAAGPASRLSSAEIERPARDGQRERNDDARFGLARGST